MSLKPSVLGNYHPALLNIIIVMSSFIMKERTQNSRSISWIASRTLSLSTIYRLLCYISHYYIHNVPPFFLLFTRRAVMYVIMRDLIKQLTDGHQGCGPRGDPRVCHATRILSSFLHNKWRHKKYHNVNCHSAYAEPFSHEYKLISSRKNNLKIWACNCITVRFSLK